MARGTAFSYAREVVKLPEIHGVSRPQFAAMHDEWNAFLARSNNDCLFLTWEWLMTWWEAFEAPHRQFWFLVARDERGDMLGLFPLLLVTGRFGVRTLQITGRGVEGYDGGSEWGTFLMPPIAPGHEEDVLAAFLQYLRRHRRSWDEIYFDNLVSDHPTTSTLRRLTRRVVLALRRDQEIDYVLRLPATYDDYLSQLTKGKRYNLRRRAARMSRDWEVEVGCLESAEAIEEYLRDYFLLVGRRHDWTPSREKVAFMRRLCAMFLVKGGLRFHVLRLNRRPVATMFGFAYGHRYYLYKGAFDPDPELRGLAPGIFLRCHVVARAIEEGLTEFDYLIGKYEYKREWSNMERRLEVVTLYGDRPGAILRAGVNKTERLLRVGPNKMWRLLRRKFPWPRSRK